MTRVNLREVASDYSGKVHFGTPYGQPVNRRQGGGYVRFEAHFQHGKLVRLDIESHVEPPEVVAARQEHEALDGALPAGANSTKPARL